MSQLGRGGLEPPTHGFSVRCSTNVNPDGTSTYDTPGDCLPSGLPDSPSDSTPADAPCGGSDAPDAPPGAVATDPDLAAIAGAWPTLPEAVRARIVGMVEAVAAMNASTPDGR